eukprot:TRINITY_DN10485_c0_g1_i1.p1 TRINITY_DN10485_c0_g1~~TRINITY_DN10485_c0_g1_i1.p1  ORF type:complete len:270 (+),score=85.63 TRINITY_DN10485_c0_g1_i1:109-810(+)
MAAAAGPGPVPVTITVNGHPVTAYGEFSFSVTGESTVGDLCEYARTQLPAVPEAVMQTQEAGPATVGGCALAPADLISQTLEPGEAVTVPFARSALQGKLPRDLVMRMYARENELRTSPEVQADYSRQIIPFNSDTTAALQRRLMKEFGLPSDPKGLRLWHTQRSHHRDDPEVMAVPLYVKYDVSRAGDLRVGHDYVDCRLVRADRTPCRLSEFVRQAEAAQRPLVIIGASYS